VPRFRKGQLKKRVDKLGSAMRLETQRFNRTVTRVLLPRAKVIAADAIQLIALEVDRNIMLGWPVDTGRSRAAWAPYAATFGEGIPGSTGTPQELEGQSQGDFEKKLGDTRPSIKLINGVEYSPYLEAGSSGQAPQGVVRRVLRNMRQQVRATFKKASSRNKKGVV
jgi:hypothetical protein